MFSNRILLMRPALYPSISPQIRAFSLARIALEPARKAAPPPPPPPTRGRKATATATTAAPAKAATKKSAPTTTKKAAPVAAPAPRTRLTEKERAARDKAKEREKLAKAKEKEKLAGAKEKEREREQARKAKEREKELVKKEKAKAREEAKKEREKAKIEAAKAIKKPYPPPPKAPMTAYLMFANDPKVERDRGEGVVDSATKASEAWKALSETERDVYRKKADKARAAWKEEVAKWVASLNLAQLMAARANREPGTRDEAAMSVLPKRPGNAYALFLGEMTSREDFREKINALAQKEGPKDDNEMAKKRIGLYGRTTANIWRSMTEKEKAVYTTKAEEAKKQWDKDFGHLITAQKETIAANVA